ncbi:MAG: peptide deformylase [Planctomycetes bacterium]|nr:peptide deformylase [Planctomycetota bacterium]
MRPELVHYPHPILRRRASAVTVFDDALRAFCREMFLVMELHQGVGLAAPQVAVGKRIFVTDHLRRRDDPSPKDRRVWINPRIERPEGLTTYEEGCLSFPGVYAKVQRHNRFTFVAQDEWGVERKLDLDVDSGEFLGIVVQHELDHLDGKVFVELLTVAQLTLVRKRLRELEVDYKKSTGNIGAVLRK